MSGDARSRALQTGLPGWVNEVVEWNAGYPDYEARHPVFPVSAGG